MNQNDYLKWLLIRRIRMVDEGTKTISKVIENILNNKFDKKKTVMELSRIEQEYGKDVFVPYSFVKQEEPWTPKYLEELKMKIMAGACSKDLFTWLKLMSDCGRGNFSS